MLTILLHSSKTMRPPGPHNEPFQEPVLISKASELSSYLKTLSASQLETAMQLSKAKAAQTHDLLAQWTNDRAKQRPAIDAFLGDIYSGLQIQTFSVSDRAYANQHLLILSGLYGGLKALDSIHPYRLEMGYRLPETPYDNLYTFWGESIAKLIPSGSAIINLSAVEFTKAVSPYRPESRDLTPRFLTVNPKSREPVFVTVHTKIARGAFARWLIQGRINDALDIIKFNDIGYRYDKSLSTDTEPVFICKEFKGIGLSVRLT